MAIQAFVPGIDLTFPHDGRVNFSNGAVCNAVGEMCGIVGYLELEAGSGTKTLSAAGGGGIIVYIGAATWATASSEFRIGLEDITAGTGIPNGTQDVYGARVAGTTAIATGFTKFLMTSGTKTVTHGDFLSITGRMPVRAGADSVAPQCWGKNEIGNTIIARAPYGMTNGTKDQDLCMVSVIVFDDGTYGWIKGTTVPLGTNTATGNVTTASTPDEYCATFTVPVPTEINRIGWNVDDVATTDDYEIILYSDPLGTPSAVQTATVDSSEKTMQSASTGFVWAPITATTLAVGTTYGIAIRVTGGTVQYNYGDLTSGFDMLKRTIPFVDNVKLATRSDQTGAFTETQTYHVPWFGFTISGFDDGASTGGGGTTSYAFIG